jgi:hypothetical protein
MHDDRYEGATDVREWLRDADPGADAWPSTFGADEAIRQARSVRRRHRFAMAGSAAAVALAVLAVPALTGWPWSRSPGSGLGAASGSVAADRATSAPAVVVTNCALDNLPVPGDLAGRGVSSPARVFVTAMDASGAYVLGNAFAVDNTVAAVILWHDKAPTVLPTSGLGTIMSTVAVNGHGVVAGTGEASGAVGFAWVYRNGTATRLPNVPGYSGMVQVTAVDEAGDVLGAALSESGGRSAVVVWPANAPSQPQVQTALTGKVGMLAGAAYAGDGQLYAWDKSATTPQLWTHDGQRHDLPLPDGLDGGAVTGVHGSWAYGVAYKTPLPKVSTTNPFVPVRWRLDGGPVTTVAGTPAESEDIFTSPFVITDVGASAGRSGQGYRALGVASDHVFVLAADGGGATPMAISDNATLIAGAVGPADDHAFAGNTRPVLWRC